jgi:hypothetical protein
MQVNIIVVLLICPKITSMLKAVFILTGFLSFLVACDSKPNKPYDYTCQRPADIPTHYSNGEPVPWDCRWHTFYKEGEVIVIRDSMGQPIALAIHHKKPKK